MLLLFLLSVFMILYPILLYPLLLWVLSPRKYILPKTFPASEQPLVSIVVVARNCATTLKDKILNCLSLDTPERGREIIIASDGSTDNTFAVANSFKPDGVKSYEFKSHTGKIPILNKIVPEATGTIILFTDSSALLSTDTLHKIVRWFEDPTVGGVCGRKILSNQATKLGRTQAGYSSYEDFIRTCESKLAGIASNEGFLYAIRKELFKPIPEAVTDDLYNAMSVIQQKKRMCYDPELTAEIPVRASRPDHELTRRRRIVCQSLNGIWLMRALLNPFEYRWYSWILLSHKVLRRLVPLFLLSLLVSNLSLAGSHPAFALLLSLQLLGYATALATHFKWFPDLSRAKHADRFLAAWYYFCLGNLGTLIGLGEFLCGRKYSKWEPVKQ